MTLRLLSVLLSTCNKEIHEGDKLRTLGCVKIETREKLSWMFKTWGDQNDKIKKSSLKIKRGTGIMECVWSRPSGHHCPPPPPHHLHDREIWYHGVYMKQTWWAGHHSLEVGPPIPRYTLFSTLSFHCICILHCVCILKVGPTNTHYYLVYRHIVLKETPLLWGCPILSLCIFSQM